MMEEDMMPDFGLDEGRWYMVLSNEGPPKVFLALRNDAGNWGLHQIHGSEAYRVGTDCRLRWIGEEPKTKRTMAGLSVEALVPADGLAKAAWLWAYGDLDECPRLCGPMDGPHHERCHTKGGVPLYADLDVMHWIATFLGDERLEATWHGQTVIDWGKQAVWEAGVRERIWVWAHRGELGPDQEAEIRNVLTRKGIWDDVREMTLRPCCKVFGKECD